MSRIGKNPVEIPDGVTVDVAGQVVYLCKTSTVTGQSIVVDGGINFQ